MQEKQRILVADDEPEIREVLRMMLGSEGYEILEAGNAAEAVAQAGYYDAGKIRHSGMYGNPGKYERPHSVFNRQIRRT